MKAEGRRQKADLVFRTAGVILHPSSFILPLVAAAAVLVAACSDKPITAVAGDPAAGKAAIERYQCGACHTAGVAGAPKVGDAGAWAPRLGQGFPALLNSALKGKGAMGPQGGGDFSDVEIARAVVYMANSSGGKFEEPKVAAAAASAPEAAASK